jgi:hypothetical protein
MTIRSWGFALIAGLLISAGPSAACTGDCDGDGEVAINEVVRGVNIALGSVPVDDCVQFDADGDGAVAINELVAAVTNALNACPSTTPVPTPSVTPTTDGAATLVIERGAGNEFVTGRAYGFGLADIRAGNQTIALYKGTLALNHRDTLAELDLRQTILDADGNVVRDASGRRRIVRIHFNHVPLRTGVFRCGEALPELPGYLLGFDASVSLRDDATFSETSLDDYFGYPQPVSEIDCTLTITSLDGGVITATYESHMLSSEANDLAYATGTLKLPVPTCTGNELSSLPPQTCYPWAF